MTVDHDLLLSGQVGVVVLVADGYRQHAGDRLGRHAAVAHDDGDQELLLALAVERPQGGERGRAVEVVLQVEVVAVAIVRRDGEVERRPVLRGVPVHHVDEGGGLVHLHQLTERGAEALGQ